MKQIPGRTFYQGHVTRNTVWRTARAFSARNSQNEKSFSVAGVKQDDICDVKCEHGGRYVKNLSKLCYQNLTYRPPCSHFTSQIFSCLTPLVPLSINLYFSIYHSEKIVLAPKPQSHKIMLKFFLVEKAYSCI